MINLVITLADASSYTQQFPSKPLLENFLSKLELFDGLFLTIHSTEKEVRINPKFIVKVEWEEERYNPSTLSDSIGCPETGFQTDQCHS